MALFPVQAEHRNPTGLFFLQEGLAVEGGMVGQIVPTVADVTQPEVALFNPNAADGYGSDSELSLVGLIDDSTTGQGYGVLFGQVLAFGQPATEISGAVRVGPATTRGSGRATLWMQSGLFLTDVFDGGTTEGSPATPSVDAITAATPVGTPLYSADGIITTGKATPQIGSLICFIENVNDLLASRVQPLPGFQFPSGVQGRKFILFAFKGA
jgi:hypothetical protein